MSSKRVHKGIFNASILTFGLLCMASCTEGGGEQGKEPPNPAEQGIDPNDQRIVRRLTRFEYDNTVRDLLVGLGLEARLLPSYFQSMPPDDVVGGFDNNARALTVGSLLFDKYQAAAEELAELLNKDLSKLLPCQAQGGEACARTFIEKVGMRAFRRPLSNTEIARYLDLYKSAQGDGFGEAIKLLTMALLQSPHFLYRPEIGVAGADGYTLSPYEIASQLSYLIWGTMPDDELFNKAKAGELATNEQIANQVSRLLRSDRARGMLDHFVDQWMVIDRLAIVAKDDKLYPELTAPMRAALRMETTAFFDQVLRKGGQPFPELLTAPYSYLNDALAKHYGVPLSTEPPDAQGLRKTNLGAGRSGLLTQGSILATHATSHSSSPVHRGKLVRERLLCQELPPPPPGLMVQLPAVDPKLSTRERFSQHSSDPACSACHRLMDPIGFGFEAFDGAGRLRMTEAGKAIDERGEIHSAGKLNGPFTGVKELSTILGKSDEVAACFAKTWFRYGYGVEETEQTHNEVQQVIDGFRGGELRFEALIQALTKVNRFRVRRGSATGMMPKPQEPPMDMAPAPADMANPQPDGGMPPASPYVATVKRDSDWATGYCSTVLVNNTGMVAGKWTVTIEVEGMINNLWNATSMPAGGTRRTFVGMPYNESLDPGASTSFGFCATK